MCYCVGGWLLVAILHVAEHGDEAAVAEMLDERLVAGTFCDSEHLLLLVADWDDHDAAGLELIHQRLWDVGGAACDDDAVEGCVVNFGEALVAVAEEALGRVVEFAKQKFCFVEETFLALDGEDLGTELAEDCGLVAAASADFEDFYARFDVEQLALRGHGGGLRDGLVAEDGDGLVVVGYIDERGVEEPVAWHLLHCSEYGFVGDAFGTQGAAHLNALALLFIGV